jgi:imidazolonepropionase-like amidohydrolase
MERIEADVFIPGKGDVIKNGCVVVEGNTIVYAGVIEGAPKEVPGTRVRSVPVVMPGLWDCHAHFFGMRRIDLASGLTTPLGVMIARTTADAARSINAGFTSIREVAGYGVFLSRVIEEGSLVGPHIYTSVGQLTPTAGHGDVHSIPPKWHREFLENAGIPGPADGVAECLKTVRRMLRWNAKLIKVVTSGGIMSEVDHPIHQQYSMEELRVIVEEATRAERIVAAHCHGKPGIMAALEAGCKTIEHGSYLDDEAADLLLAKGAIYVPTIWVSHANAMSAKAMGAPDYVIAKIQPVVKRHEEAVKLALRKGLKIAVGTDITLSYSNGIMEWGMNAHELVHLNNLGMKTMDVIEAATATGPLTLGPQAPRSGLLREGYTADLITVAKSPVQDLSVLTNVDNVRLVMKSGKVVKNLDN